MGPVERFLLRNSIFHQEIQKMAQTKSEDMPETKSEDIEVCGPRRATRTAVAVRDCKREDQHKHNILPKLTLFLVGLCLFLFVASPREILSLG